MNTLIRRPLAIAVGLAIQSTSVQAQEATSGAVLEEVVVTANRRTESVLDVPYNITALSADQLEAAGVSDISGMIRMVPGLSTFDEGPRVSGNRNNFNIRGLNVNSLGNEDDNPRIGQATVSTYVGETPVFFPLKLVDLDRIEVLRGPQGTLYGSGSVGGTVRFIPNKPDFDGFTIDVNAEASLTKKSDDVGYEGNVTINVPLNDAFAFRGSVGYEEIPGFIDALGLVQHTGTPEQPGAVILADPADILGSPAALAAEKEDVNDGEVTFARVGLRFVPSDRMDLNVNYHYQQTKVGSRYEDNPYYGTGEEYVMYKAFTDPHDASIQLGSVDMEFDLGFARLTSASAYSEINIDSVSESSGFLRTNIPQYYFGLPRIISPIIRGQNSQTFTQEIRLVSEAGGRIEWVAGGFYLENDLDFDLFQPLFGVNDYTNAYFGLNPPLNFTDVLATGGTEQEFRDMAVFGELTLNITDRWQVTGGVRIFDQELDGTSGIPLPFASRTIEFFYYGSATDDFLLGGINPTENEVSDEIFKVNTSYEVTDDMLAFFTWSQGFRAGGANQLPEIDPFGNDYSDILRFQSDDAENYEIGVKGTWNARVNYTATAFWVDWQDFQTTLSSLFGIAYVDNIGGARSRGLELELNGLLTDQLTFGLSYTYIDAETTDAFEQQSGNPETIVPDGTTLPGSSEHTFFGHLQYEYPLATSKLVFYTDLAYRSDTNSAFIDQPLLATDNFVPLDDFSVWNMSITWARDNYSITAFGDNISNTRATTVVSSQDFFGAQDQGHGVIKPQTFGLRFKWSYQ